MKILLIGDTHGGIKPLLKIIQASYSYEIDCIFQLGDFGFIMDPKREKDLFELLDPAIAARGIPFYWLDGNHENFDRMAELGLDRHKSEFQKLTDHLIYSGRGNIFDFDGVKFCSYGGAISVNQDVLIPHISWWRREEIDFDHISSIDQPFDVLLSHDAPIGSARLQAYLDVNDFWPERLQRLSRFNASFLNDLMVRCGAIRAYHGHTHFSYHENVKFGNKYRSITGLDKVDKLAENLCCLVVDTSNLKAKP